MTFNSKRLLPLALIALVVCSMFAVALAAATIDPSGDSDDGVTITGFAAEEGQNESVIYETANGSDMLDNFEDLSAVVEYDMNMLVEYDIDDAKIDSGGSDDTMPLTV